MYHSAGHRNTLYCEIHIYSMSDSAINISDTAAFGRPGHLRESVRVSSYLD